jgi:xanthine dehydrogenase accessory factor
MKDALAIFDFIRVAQRRGERTALVTITAVEGGSSRSPGTHLAVSESGRWQGSLSGGCIEAAVVGEARRIIEGGKPEELRFGRGSRFIDIRLPCGGAIDLLIIPDPDAAILDQAATQLDQRHPVTLALFRSGAMAIESLPHASFDAWRGDDFLARHEPDLRVLAIGQGSETIALARIAIAYGAQVEVLSLLRGSARLAGWREPGRIGDWPLS